MNTITAILFGGCLALLIFVSAAAYAKYKFTSDKTIHHGSDNDPDCTSCPEYKIYCSGCKRCNYD